MNQMPGIVLEVKNYRCFTDALPLVIPISSQNIALTGENNAGKSAALKFFAEFAELWPVMNAQGLALAGTRQSIGVAMKFVEDQNEVFTDFGQRDLTITLRRARQPSGVDAGMALSTVEARYVRGSNAVFFRAFDFAGNELSSLSAFIDDEFIYSGGTKLIAPIFSSVLRKLASVRYVPSARITSHALGPLEALFISGPGLVSKWNEWKNGVNKATAEKCVEIEQRLAEIFGFRSLQINAAEGNMTLTLVINGRRRRAREVGNGFLHVFAVVANFLAQPSAMALIDEPENGLHPRLQSALLQLVGEVAVEGLLFATHSVGLARAFADEVVVLKKEEKGVRCSPLHGIKNMSEFLGEMSFSAYRELGYRKILLVEGVTDKAVIDLWLGRFFAARDVLVLPLFGETLISNADSAVNVLTEYSRLASEVFVLIDSEKSSQSDKLSRLRSEFLETCAKLGYIAQALARRALENYFPGASISKVYGVKDEALSEFEDLRSRPYWAKHKNVQLARHTDVADLAGSDLLVFLEKVAKA